MEKIILASASPRRKELLEMLGFDIEVRPSSCDEDIEASSPAELVENLSALKCGDVAKNAEKGSVVLGADTVVALDGRILGKPADETEAFRMLRELSGKTHSVYTGVTIKRSGTDKTLTFSKQTSVTFYDATDEEITRYIATGEPMDKAGAYGIQGKGAFLVKEINGDFYTVVGLPAAEVYHALSSF